MKTLLITQSNYIPWKGYFDMIRAADEFVIYDDMQYTRRDWRNRNMIKTAQGAQWLTVPVNVKGKFTQKINETTIADSDWARQHWATISLAYKNALYFEEYSQLFAELYNSELKNSLTEINVRFLKAVCAQLEITTPFLDSRSFRLNEERTQRLVDICVERGATHYITGPSAKAYMDESRFAAAGIEILYADFSGYPEYRQLHGAFVPTVSILDLIFNEGPNALSFMKDLHQGKISGKSSLSAVGA